MIEVIKHSLGLCGENHPHLLNLSIIGIGIAGYLTYIKSLLTIKIKLWNKKNKNLT